MKLRVTDRCTLEPQVEAHAAEMFSVLSDPAIYAFENELPPSLPRRRVIVNSAHASSSHKSNTALVGSALGRLGLMVTPKKHVQT